MKELDEKMKKIKKYIDKIEVMKKNIKECNMLIDKELQKKKRLISNILN